MSTVVATAADYRTIDRFPGYRFGSDGTVWTAWNKVPASPVRGWKFVIGESWRQMKFTTARGGYSRVCLRDRRMHLVHRLILEAFVGPCPAGLECRHGNGDPADNCIDNLSWGTHSANCLDKEDHGNGFRGESNRTARLTESQVIEIRRRCAAGESQLDVRRDYEIDQSHISSIVRRVIWKHV